jgi:hypothetical protein
MNQNDYTAFADAWANAHEIMPAGKVLSQGGMKAVIDALKNYPLDTLLLAINHHVKTAPFAPAPKDIIDLLEMKQKRLSADEAWAMMPKDEFETVVWTEEMAAAYDIAYDLIVDGDRIAARMAFKGAYERLCSEADLMSKPVRWKVALGYDKALIEPVLQKAVELGRISHESVQHYLPAPMDAGPIAGLLTGKVLELPNNAEHLRERWSGLKQALDDANKRVSEERQRAIREAAEKRIEFEERRQAAVDLVKKKIEEMQKVQKMGGTE